MSDLVDKALAFGFSHAADLDPSTLVLLAEVRDMCSADRCHQYDKNWVCPPACGSLDENRKKMEGYTSGLLVQTTGLMEDDFDYEVMEKTGRLQQQSFASFRDILLADYPDILALGSGGCQICETCTYPDAPCRFPEKAIPSMEAFGLWVSDVCVKNQLGYNYGPHTITYTSCYLFDKK